MAETTIGNREAVQLLHPRTKSGWEMDYETRKYLCVVRDGEGHILAKAEGYDDAWRLARERDERILRLSRAVTPRRAMQPFFGLAWAITMGSACGCVAGLVYLLFRYGSIPAMIRFQPVGVLCGVSGFVMMGVLLYWLGKEESAHDAEVSPVQRMWDDDTYYR